VLSRHAMTIDISELDICSPTGSLWFVPGGAFALFGTVFATLGFPSGFPLIFGGLFALIGVVILVVMKKERERVFWLLRHGESVKARVTGIEHYTVQKNKRNVRRYELVAQWEDPANGVRYSFESQPLKRNPSDNVIGEIVEVFIDPKNPDKYYFHFSQ